MWVNVWVCILNFDDSQRNTLYITCSCTTFITLVLARSLARLRAIPFEKIVISICGIVSEAYSWATDMIIRQLNFYLLLWLAECQAAIWKQEKQQQNQTKTPVILNPSIQYNLLASDRLITYINNILVLWVIDYRQMGLKDMYLS